MNRIDQHQMFAALTGLVIVLFLLSQQRIAGRWQRPFRITAIALFLLALGAALIEVVLWLAGITL